MAASSWGHMPSGLDRALQLFSVCSAGRASRSTPSPPPAPGARRLTLSPSLRAAHCERRCLGDCSAGARDGSSQQHLLLPWPLPMRSAALCCITIKWCCLQKTRVLVMMQGWCCGADGLQLQHLCWQQPQGLPSVPGELGPAICMPSGCPQPANKVLYLQLIFVRMLVGLLYVPALPPFPASWFLQARQKSGNFPLPGNKNGYVECSTQGAFVQKCNGNLVWNQASYPPPRLDQMARVCLLILVHGILLTMNNVFSQVTSAEGTELPVRVVQGSAESSVAKEYTLKLD